MDNVLQIKKFKASPTVGPEDEEETEENYPVERTVEQKVFEIDHILEQIFSLLDTPDLFACRLVSHRFLNFVRRPLEQQITKSFSPETMKSDWEGQDSSGRTLAHLTEFLEQSSPSSSKSNPNQIPSFPCINFQFDGTTLGNKIIQNFLNIHGATIRKLSMDPLIPVFHNIPDENIFMEQLCDLLTTQATQLESLVITVYLRVKLPQRIQIQGVINEDPHPRYNNFPLVNNDPEFQQISSRVESLPRKSSLKILKISGVGLTKAMECLLQLSPKLQEVIFEDDYYYVNLLQPVNRIHLLKSLIFKPVLQSHFYTTFNMDSMEKMSLDRNLRLRELNICFSEAWQTCRFNRQDESKLVAMINRILESNKETLEVLSLSNVAFLRGKEMPTCMPKLRNLQYKINDYEMLAPNVFFKIFPNGFSWTETFPKLTSVKLDYYSDFDDDLSYEFLNCLDCGGDGEGALSLVVKKFALDLKGWEDWECRTIPQSVSQTIQMFFPNASIQFNFT